MELETIASSFDLLPDQGLIHSIFKNEKICGKWKLNFAAKMVVPSFASCDLWSPKSCTIAWITNTLFILHGQKTGPIYKHLECGKRSTWPVTGIITYIALSIWLLHQDIDSWEPRDISCNKSVCPAEERLSKAFLCQFFKWSRAPHHRPLLPGYHWFGDSGKKDAAAEVTTISGWCFRSCWAQPAVQLHAKLPIQLRWLIS